MRIRLIILIVLLVAVYSCKEKKIRVAIIDNDKQTIDAVVKPDTVILASIGSTQITGQIIQYRLATESAYENTGLNKSAALIMVINDVIELELAKKYQQQATPIEIEQFKQHADQTSKAPEILKRVKAVFGQDIKAYDLWYISPKIVNQKIRDYFSANKSQNRDALNQIKPAFKLLKSGKEMKTLAKIYNLTYSVDSLSINAPDVAPALQNYPDARIPQESPILKYVRKIKAGEIYPGIIEENYSFMVIKLLKQTNNKYLIERISISKPEFDTWLRKEAANFNFSINDAALKQEILNNYGNLWWVKYLN